jgi:CheY-like chemotaxis protein
MPGWQSEHIAPELRRCTMRPLVSMYVTKRKVRMQPVIVVVDNDEPFRDLLVDLLSDEGYRVVTAMTRAEAIETIRQERPALVILDLRMEAPDSGLQIIRTVRDNPLTATLPLLLCSADVTGIAAHAPFLEEHHVLALNKPFDLNHLLELICQLVALFDASDAQGA